MHGPEHHVIVPCVLLTAYRNNGGGIELEKALREAVRRASQVPGGACGYWGVCGAAAGAGIYLSILLGSNPVHKDAWPIPQRLVSDCLRAIADVGGPRCCKRTGRLAITRGDAAGQGLLPLFPRKPGVPVPRLSLFPRLSNAKRVNIIWASAKKTQQETVSHKWRCRFLLFGSKAADECPAG